MIMTNKNDNDNDIRRKIQINGFLSNTTDKINGYDQRLFTASRQYHLCQTNREQTLRPAFLFRMRVRGKRRRTGEVQGMSYD